MTTTKVVQFLADVQVMMAVHFQDRHIVFPRFGASELYESFGPTFAQDLQNHFTPEAFAAIFKVSRNAYWFLLTVATTAAVADQFPATTEDVEHALEIQRRIVFCVPGNRALLQKVTSSSPACLNESEQIEAGHLCFTLLEVGGPEGESVVFNPLYL